MEDADAVIQAGLTAKEKSSFIKSLPFLSRFLCAFLCVYGAHLCICQPSSRYTPGPGSTAGLPPAAGVRDAGVVGSGAAGAGGRGGQHVRQAGVDTARRRRGDRPELHRGRPPRPGRRHRQLPPARKRARPAHQTPGTDQPPAQATAPRNGSAHIHICVTPLRICAISSSAA